MLAMYGSAKHSYVKTSQLLRVHFQFYVVITVHMVWLGFGTINSWIGLKKDHGLA